MRTSWTTWRQPFSPPPLEGGGKIVLALAIALLLTGCDPRQDMGEQPKSRPLQGNANFPDGASARPLVSGTIPRDAANVPGAPYGSSRQPKQVDASDLVDERQPIPLEITAGTLDRGQQQFNIYCAPCHGALGNGNGMIAQRGFQHPPSYHVDRLRTIGDGHLFNVITQGYGGMYSYNDKIAPTDRWAIVAYIRALQAAPDVAQADAKTRSELVASGDVKPIPARWRQ